MEQSTLWGRKKQSPAHPTAPFSQSPMTQGERIPVNVQQVLQRPDTLQPHDLHTLQRTMGNQVVQRLLQEPSPPAEKNEIQKPRPISRFRPLAHSTASPVQRLQAPLIQRSTETDELRSFSQKYLAIVDKIRDKGKISWWQRRKLKKLNKLAAQKGFTNTESTMTGLLARLANYKKKNGDNLQDILDAFDPDKRTGENAFDAVAGGTFSPSIGEGMQFEKSSGFHKTYAKTVHEEFEGEMGRKGTSFLDARINMTISKIRQLYKKHRETEGDNPTNRSVLVFMGTEWFFNSGNTPVSRKDLHYIIQTFRAISALYPEMVIVPGTVLSGEFDQTTQKFRKNITNTAVVLWNGNVLHTINKAGNAGDFFDEEGGNYVRGTEKPIFNLGDLRFAIDICIDHGSRKRAQKYIQDNGEEPVDVHIVTSSGQSIEYASMATGDYGIGLSSDAQGMGRFGAFDRDDDSGDETWELPEEILGGDFSPNESHIRKFQQQKLSKEKKFSKLDENSKKFQKELDKRTEEVVYTQKSERAWLNYYKAMPLKRS